MFEKRGVPLLTLVVGHTVLLNVEFCAVLGVIFGAIFSVIFFYLIGLLASWSSEP